MVDARLHPRLQALLEAEGWQGLSQAQEEAWGPIRAGTHTLLVAPTGSGKTESAVLPILDRLLEERERLEQAGRPWPSGFKVLYITPLRALNRDLLGRLMHWAQTLGFTIGVRHGDTSQAERAKQSRRPPDLLITTPETTQLLLYGDTLRQHLATVRFAVVDEVHDLATSERGAQLAVALARIDQVGPPHSKAKERSIAPVRGARFQRIGLSATIHDPQNVATFLAPGATVVEVAHEKHRELSVVRPEVTEADHDLGNELAIPGAAVAQLRTVRSLIESHERVLVFVNTRDGAEVLANRSALLDEAQGQEPVLGLHHGSLSTEHRVETEAAFKAGRIKALVATSSMELGIDVGAIDHVIQIQSPRSVARMMQRLGRAGHHIDGVSRGTMVTIGPEDHLECQAIAELAVQGRLEPAPIRPAPLTVLANQLVALSNEYHDVEPGWVLDLLHQTHPFRDLEEGVLLQAWDALVEAKTVFEEAGHLQRSGRSRRHFLEHISLIPDEKTYRIFDEAHKKTIGTVDEGFLAGVHPGMVFIMAGRGWRILEVDNEAARIRVAQAKDLGGTPQWSGSMLPVSLEVAQATARLRQAIVDGRSLPGAATPVLAQVEQGLVVPTDERIVLEQGRGVVVAHIALGTRGNEALALLTGTLLAQRGACMGTDHDAYRITFRGAKAQQVLETWQALDADSLEVLLGLILRDHPLMRRQLVQVAKEFGALPKDLDPTRVTKKTVSRLWEQFALQEETLARLIHDRFDLPAVEGFLRNLDPEDIPIQALGPLATADESLALVMPRSDKTLLAQVRRRIETSDVVLLCTQCGHQVPTDVAGVPARPRCRRCGAQQMACLRHWDLERWPGLKKGAQGVEPSVRKRVLANASLMAGFGANAARLLVARGVGAQTAARILQRVQDPEDPTFWRELLHAELEYARTRSMW